MCLKSFSYVSMHTKDCLMRNFGLPNYGDTQCVHILVYTTQFGDIYLSIYLSTGKPCWYLMRNCGLPDCGDITCVHIWVQTCLCTHISCSSYFYLSLFWSIIQPCYMEVSDRLKSIIVKSVKMI